MCKCWGFVAAASRDNSCDLQYRMRIYRDSDKGNNNNVKSFKQKKALLRILIKIVLWQEVGQQLFLGIFLAA